MYLAGAVVASWSLTQEVSGSSPFTVMTIFLSLNSLNSVKTFRKNSSVFLTYFSDVFLGRLDLDPTLNWEISLNLCILS